MSKAQNGASNEHFPKVTKFLSLRDCLQSCVVAQVKVSELLYCNETVSEPLSGVVYNVAHVAVLYNNEHADKRTGLNIM